MIRRWSNTFNWVEVREPYPNHFIIRKDSSSEWVLLIDLNSWEKIESFYISNGYLEDKIYTMTTIIDQGISKTLITGNSFKLPVEVPLPIKQTSCSHEWKPYQGIIETYNYCILCDEKNHK